VLHFSEPLHPLECCCWWLSFQWPPSSRQPPAAQPLLSAYSRRPLDLCKSRIYCNALQMCHRSLGAPCGSTWFCNGPGQQICQVGCARHQGRPQAHSSVDEPQVQVVSDLKPVLLMLCYLCPALQVQAQPLLPPGLVMLALPGHGGAAAPASTRTYSVPAARRLMQDGSSSSGDTSGSANSSSTNGTAVSGIYTCQATPSAGYPPPPTWDPSNPCSSYDNAPTGRVEVLMADGEADVTLRAVVVRCMSCAHPWQDAVTHFGPQCGQ
jgi:hypothetical protein